MNHQSVRSRKMRRIDVAVLNWLIILWKSIREQALDHFLVVELCKRAVLELANPDPR